MSYFKLLPALLVFSSLGGGAAAYCAVRLTEPFALGSNQVGVVWGAGIFFALVLAVSFLLLPFSGRRWVGAIQVLGFSLFGLMSVLLAAVLSWEALRIVAALLRVVGIPGGSLLPWSLEGSRGHEWMAWFVLSGSLVVFLGGLLTAQRAALVRHVDVSVKGLPDALGGFRILQLSDLHIGPGIGRNRVEKIVRQCADLRADLIAVTGDLADGDAAKLREESAPLTELEAPLGVWFVTGNHDYYSGVDPWCARATELGMHVLINESRTLDYRGARIQVAGVTDPSGGVFKKGHRPQLKEARGVDEAELRLLLAHQPNCAREAADLGFDLQLSGHTHGGQYFPFNLLIHAVQRYVAGLYSIEQMTLYVHRGTTWWGPPMRLGSRHEIVVLELNPA